MDGVMMSVVEKTATEEDKDEDETAVAATVSRAATATQARRTEEDLCDHAFEDARCLAIAGGGLAKAVILRVSFLEDFFRRRE